MTLFSFINLNKPIGLTSHDVVARVRRMLRDRGLKDVKVGHAGTLDPLATGVLIVCLGAATRLSEYVMGHDKTYRAEITLGVETATYDAEGDVVVTADASRITRDEVVRALHAFIGHIDQIPPIYSAIKQGGRKLYDIARAGQTAELAPRPVVIHGIAVERFSTDDAEHPVVTCEIRCSAGTYIRSIAHDLGAALGVGAHLTSLVRTASGAFRIEQAVTLEQLAAAADWSALTVAPLEGLKDFPSIPLTASAWEEISHGRAIPGGGGDGETVCAVQDGRLRAILRAESGQWLPHKVFLSTDMELCLSATLRLQSACSTSTPLPDPTLVAFAIMNHVTSLNDVHLTQSALVTIGVFDGVHIGHQRLIRQLVERARASGQLTVVLTFFPHPDAVLHHISGRYYLTTPEQRAEELTKLGVDWVITQTFDEQFRHTRAADYVEQLCAHIPIKALWVGKDFHLGYEREGDVAFLRREGAQRGFTVHEVELVESADHQTISSTRIRELVQSGAVEEAAALLGRPYTVRGVVVQGDQRGRTIGFPTANVQLWDDQVLPAFGVYAGYARFDGEVHACVTNLGVRPTFDGTRLRVESHLFDFARDIYGKTLTVSFEHWLRGEMKFPTVQDLVAQIREDAQRGRALLSS